MLTTTDLLAAPQYERLTVQTPLGIRFWDSARDSQVIEALRVSARPAGEPGAPPTWAFRTASGIYAFSDLPGLRPFERPAPGTPAPPFPTGPPGLRQFWIDVADAAGDFNAVTFVVSAPLAGLFPPGPSPPRFLLFSSPSRLAGAGVAAVRADLVDAATGGPASFAVLQVQVPGSGLIVGIADEQGRVSVMFPFPTAVRTSNPPPAPTPSWTLTITARYAPAALTLVPTAPPSRLLPPGPGRPLLGSIVAQAAATIIPPAGGAMVGSLSVTLTAGAELVLKSQSRSELVIRSV
jgi:hypothetical protein